MSIDTPCTKVCMMDPRTALCIGCGRTIAEIGQWSQLPPAARRAIMAQLPQRMADAGMTQAPPAARHG